MVQGKWFATGSDISLPLSIRQQVFSRGEDTLDAFAQQVVVFDGELAVGAARLWWADGAFHVGDIGVLADKRGLGFGDLLVRLLLFKALTHGATLICLFPTTETIAFFTKYGFSPNGNGSLSILAQDVHLSHCGGNCAECGHRSEECIPKALRGEHEVLPRTSAGD